MSNQKDSAAGRQSITCEIEHCSAPMSCFHYCSFHHQRICMEGRSLSDAKCSFSEAAAEDQNSNDADKNSSGPRTESKATPASSVDPDYEPCPDPRCNETLGAMPMPQCVAAVAWAEESDKLRVVAEAARDFVWEPENWEAYQDSKDSDSVAWPPEFVLMAQAVEKQYGPMPLDDDQVPSAVKAGTTTQG